MPQAASSTQMGHFETETLALPENRAALAGLIGHWIDWLHDRNGLKYVTLGLDSSVNLAAIRPLRAPPSCAYLRNLRKTS